MDMRNWCYTAIFSATSYWRHTNHLNEYHPQKVDVSHYYNSKLVNRFTAVRSKVLTSLKEVSVHYIIGTWGTWHYSPENPKGIFHLYKSQIIKTLSDEDSDHCTEIPSWHIGCLSKNIVCVLFRTKLIVSEKGSEQAVHHGTNRNFTNASWRNVKVTWSPHMIPFG